MARLYFVPLQKAAYPLSPLIFHFVINPIYLAFGANLVDFKNEYTLVDRYKRERDDEYENSVL